AGDSSGPSRKPGRGGRRRRRAPRLCPQLPDPQGAGVRGHQGQRAPHRGREGRPDPPRGRDADRGAPARFGHRGCVAHLPRPRGPGRQAVRLHHVGRHRRQAGRAGGSDRPPHHRAGRAHQVAGRHQRPRAPAPAGSPGDQGVGDRRGL
ncbi:MAG: LSU ribosomal protein L9p, partial [uncultured Gemmatimonadetes bacterium]